MKTFLLNLFLWLLISLQAQSFQKSIISDTQTNGAYGILEKDIDGDGDLDLLTASAIDNTLAVQINDGNGIFSQTIITNSLDGASYIDAADFDNDGDMDFVGLGNTDLIWYENDNNGFTPHIIATGLNDPLQVRVYDIGSLTDPGTPDGDIDIGLLVSGDNTATVYMNDGTNTFSRLNLISINSPQYLHGGDFNGDNTDDLVITSYGNDEILWYKLGTLGFVTGGTVTTGFDGAFGVEGGDIDNDGDDDVIATAFLANEVAWFENTDGTGTHFTKHTIDNNLPGASYIHWVDIDNDGDKDIIVSAYGDLGSVTGSQIAIYYNDGNQNFTKAIVENTETGNATLSVQDFNNDGTYDIAFAASESNKFVLLAQNTASVPENTLHQFVCFPNPATDYIQIKSDFPVKEILLMDITGRIVQKGTQTTLDVDRYNKGYYLLKVYFKNGQKATQKILIK